jgi:CspA family cold shock protein
VQGVVKSYDPHTGAGVVVRDTDRVDHDLAADALAGSIFRMLRQGQRVVFDLDADGRATRLRLGSEADMGTPSGPPPGAGAPYNEDHTIGAAGEAAETVEHPPGG